MSAYSLQQQLAAARESIERLSGQIAGARGNAAGVAQATEVRQIAHCLNQEPTAIGHGRISGCADSRSTTRSRLGVGRRHRRRYRAESADREMGGTVPVPAR